MKLMRQWFAVRCCCTPMKILGFFALEPRGGSEYYVRDAHGQEHRIELKLISKMTCVAGEPPLPAFNVDFYEDREIAIYSDDRPIQFWRTIPGFVEAQHEEERR